MIFELSGRYSSTLTSDTKQMKIELRKQSPKLFANSLGNDRFMRVCKSFVVRVHDAGHFWGRHNGQQMKRECIISFHQRSALKSASAFY
jgi:hypothetical protein